MEDLLHFVIDFEMGQKLMNDMFYWSDIEKNLIKLLKKKNQLVGGKVSNLIDKKRQREYYGEEREIADRVELKFSDRQDSQIKQQITIFIGLKRKGMFGKLLIMTVITVLALKFIKYVIITLLLAYYSRSPSSSSSAHSQPNNIVQEKDNKNNEDQIIGFQPEEPQKQQIQREHKIRSKFPEEAKSQAKAKTLLDPTSQSLTLQSQIRQLLENDKNLEMRIVTGTHTYQRQINEHNSVTAKLKSQLTELRKQMIRTKEKLLEKGKTSPSQIARQRDQLSIQVQKLKIKLAKHEDLTAAYENLKGELQFCQKQLTQSYQNEKDLKKKVQIHSSNHTNEYALIDRYKFMEKKYTQMKKQLQEQKNLIRSRNANSPASNSPRTHFSNSRVSQSSNKRTATIHYYRFLADSAFLDLSAKEFIYTQLNTVLRGVLKTDSILKSTEIRKENPIEIIKEVEDVLIVLELKNSRVFAAYSHQPFSQQEGHNTGYILDISGARVFRNKVNDGIVSCSADSLIWGLNEFIIKWPDILYLNVSKKKNIFWENNLTIAELTQSEKQWAPISQAEVFRIVKI